jgi:hypothetical protein
MIALHGVRKSFGSNLTLDGKMIAIHSVRKSFGSNLTLDGKMIAIRACAGRMEATSPWTAK